MEDFWNRAKSFAEEAAKKSQSLTTNSFADLVAETTKKSKELALEASKKADQIKTAAIKQADSIQIKSITDIIPLSTIVDLSSSSSSSSSEIIITEPELNKFGVTDDLRLFVKGLTSATFKNFPVNDEVELSDSPTIGSNVRKDLTDWQERHATLVLTTVNEIKKLRYELCPRVMKERRFWKIYFTLVSSHVSPYEKQYMEEARRKADEKAKDDKMKSAAATEKASTSEGTERTLHSKTSSAEQDLDTFLLGDLEDSDGHDDGPDDADESFEDDFDKIDNSDVEEEKHSDEAKTTYEKEEKHGRAAKRVSRCCVASGLSGGAVEICG
ncbi:hypothetical protein ACFE04_030071 [Oxalis oulophora]